MAPRERELEARIALAQRWMFILPGFGVVLVLAPDGIARSATAYWIAWWLPACVLSAAAFFASRLPAASYGLTLRRVLPSIARGTVSSLVLIALGLGALVGLRAGGYIASGTPLVQPRVDTELAAYALVAAPLQELVFRGLFQTAARKIFGGETRRASVAAVAFSTTCYAMSHLAWSVPAALATIIPGLVWGVQMERDRTLVGVAASHVVVGAFFVGATPLWTILSAR